ncbi:MAG: hypothetical protein AAF569_08290 [Pseudomonadota bacterium]
MIRINLEFFSKETEFLEKEFEIELPQQVIFEAAEINHADDLIGLGYDVTPEFVAYVEKKYPEISKNFQVYDAQFTGEYADQYEEE